eukprot:jgi/Mesvir1/23497/Mv22339-RA.1
MALTCAALPACFPPAARISTPAASSTSRSRPCLQPSASHQAARAASTLLGSPLLARSQALVLRQSNPARRMRLQTMARANDADLEEQVEMIELDALERMDKTIESVRSNMNTVRTGRANASLLDRVEVEYYGAMTPLKSLAQVNTPDSSTIVVSPFDKKTIGDIERALIKSDIGITPSNDGSVIRLAVPMLTKERRQELIKVVSKLSEEGKIALRNVRRDSIKAYEKMEKDDGLSKDQCHDKCEDIQKHLDSYVAKIDEMMKKKEAELLQV